MAEADQSILQSYLLAWKPCLDYLETLALRSAAELRLAAIVQDQSDGMPVAVDTIATALPDPPSDLSALARLLRFLARKQIFVEESDPHLGEIFYAPTPASEKLAKEAAAATVESLSSLSEIVRSGDGATGTEPELQKLFDVATAASAEIVVDALLAVYKDQLATLKTLVQVGGASGPAAAQEKITKACPELRVTNFDLPDSVAAAPEIASVLYVSGNFLEDEIPPADAILLKSILHKYGDGDCLKLLKNCRKAIPDTGKLILVEVVLDPEDQSPAGDAGVALDLAVLAVSGGIERTEEEWRDLLKPAGFPRINIIKLPAVVSVVEAYPN